MAEDVTLPYPTLTTKSNVKVLDVQTNTEVSMPTRYVLQCKHDQSTTRTQMIELVYN